MRNIPMFMKNSVILENMQQPYIAPNNRKCKRFAIDKGVYAMMSWNEPEAQVVLGHVIDINKEGCGISYIAERSTAETFLMQKICKLKFISTLKVFELDKNTVLYDKELIAFSTDRISTRRCGIKFDDFVKVKYLL
jgi:hypothetical protein